MAESYVLRLSCADRPGIVSAVTGALFDHGANILEAQQFDDLEAGRFFARLQFEGISDGATLEHFRAALGPVAARFDMDWSLRPQGEKRRVLILASKFDHCLADLLYRWRTGELPMDLVGVVSNHPRETYERLRFDDLEFHHLPVTRGSKEAQEAQIWSLVQSTGADLVVLARYMQILSDDLAAKLSGRCINIHHSFLPGFKGAKPYHQAHARGVKLIGATAHYATRDLDEGPIIHQDVVRVTHRHGVDDPVRKGRDLEKMVLAQAVRWHLEGRVLVYGNKTVVFD